MARGKPEHFFQYEAKQLKQEAVSLYKPDCEVERHTTCFVFACKFSNYSYNIFFVPIPYSSFLTLRVQLGVHSHSSFKQYFKPYAPRRLFCSVRSVGSEDGDDV